VEAAEVARTYGVMRDLMDGQLLAADELEIGRVADIEAEWTPEGWLVLRRLWCGPEALARRIGSRPGRLVAWLLGGRFDRSIPIDEVAALDNLAIRLRQPSGRYQVGRSERWLDRHLVRFLPGARR
jgi:hypothetical protein